MAMSGVLHRELVQTELRAHFLELGGLRILEAYPNEAVGTLEILADVFLGDVGELPAFLVRDTIDKHDDDSPCVVARIIAAEARARHHVSAKSARGVCYTATDPWSVEVSASYGFRVCQFPRRTPLPLPSPRPTSRFSCSRAPPCTLRLTAISSP